MQAEDVLPIVVPGIIIQVMIQAYYIKHCWENTCLSQRQKTTYIIAIAILTLPAAAVYLFNSREKKPKQTNDFKGIEVDPNTRQGIFVLLVVAFEIFAMRIIMDNFDNAYQALLIGLLTYCFIIMLINNLLIKENPRLLYYLLPATQLLLAVPIEYLDNSYYAQFIVIIVTAGIINKFPLHLAKVYTIAAFCAFWAGGAAKALKYYSVSNFDGIVSYLYINTLVFILLIAAFYTLKKQLLTNKQLDAALKRVAEQALQLEVMGALAERNRITAEIHDTVGHTLTSAVISIEAAEKFLGQENREAKDKLFLAKEQVRRGLDEIRSSVKTIREGGEKAFVPELKRLLGDIRQETGLSITDIIELKSDLLTIQQSVLLSAVKECVTNSLKHGQCTGADLLIQEYKDTVCLIFSDNGKGTDHIIMGFGLGAMMERVQGIGGTLNIDSAKGEGFTVVISIPIGKEQGGDPS